MLHLLHSGAKCEWTSSSTLFFVASLPTWLLWCFPLLLWPRAHEFSRHASIYLRNGDSWYRNWFLFVSFLATWVASAIPTRWSTWMRITAVLPGWEVSISALSRYAPSWMVRRLCTVIRYAILAWFFLSVVWWSKLGLVDEGQLHWDHMSSLFFSLDMSFISRDGAALAAAGRSSTTKRKKSLSSDIIAVIVVIILLPPWPWLLLWHERERSLSTTVNSLRFAWLLST